MATRLEAMQERVRLVSSKWLRSQTKMIIRMRKSQPLKAKEFVAPEILLNKKLELMPFFNCAAMTIVKEWIQKEKVLERDVEN